MLAAALHHCVILRLQQHRNKGKKQRRKRLLSLEYDMAGVERVSQPTLRSRHRAQQQQQSLHAQRCTPRHGFSTKGCCAAATAAVLLYLCCAIDIAAAQQKLCPSRWSTAVLSVARTGLAAASLPSQGLAIFAGGYEGLSRGLRGLSLQRVVCCEGVRGLLCWAEGGAL